jgi:hypothetical protein
MKNCRSRDRRDEYDMHNESFCLFLGAGHHQRVYCRKGKGKGPKAVDIDRLE